jgi:hypothetical protein
MHFRNRLYFVGASRANAKTYKFSIRYSETTTARADPLVAISAAISASRFGSAAVI